MKFAGHCYRHPELPASKLVLWEPSKVKLKEVKVTSLILKKGHRICDSWGNMYMHEGHEDLGNNSAVPTCMRDMKI